MIYELAPGGHVVIHVRHFKIWNKFLDTLPSTADNIEYGTPEIAEERVRLFKEQYVPQNKIFAMAGHSEGLFVSDRIYVTPAKTTKEILQDP